VKQVRRP